ncbi:integrase [Pyrococcus kukulkanii]|uniref:integrase n=1 Tax=Pyrococcus kukulkanii TaxID=1609559 RepID=UPI003565E877
MNEFWSRYREAFDKWLSVRVSDETRRSYMNALERFFKTYTITSYSDLEDALVEENYKRNLAKGLRNFIKFLKGRGEISKNTYEDLKEIIRLKKVKPRRNFPTTEEIAEAYKHFEQHPAFSIIFKLLVFTGLRLRHVVYLLNTYSRDKLIVLENFAKYPLFEAAMGNKPVFYAYMPRDFALSLEPIVIDYDYVKNRLRYKNVNASGIRKWFFNYLMEHEVPLQVIKFIVGQTPSGVAEEYYLKLERHADRWYSRVVDELKKVLEG